jgi:polyhydroxybutyrate depolymerase
MPALPVDALKIKAKSMKCLCKLSTLILVLAIVACSKSPDKVPEEEIMFGRNEVIMPIDGKDRQVVYHIPETYSPKEKRPLVIMLHGSSGTGQRFYNISGWKEIAEEENFIAIFPTALEYPIAGTNRTSTKWTGDGLVNDVPPGTEIFDDVPFIRATVEYFLQKYNVDEKRMYISGFSGGGGFVRSRVLTEMSNVFAAAGTGGGIGLFQPKEVVHQRNMPLFTILGTMDEAIMQAIGSMQELPIQGEDLMAHPALNQQITSMLETLRMNPNYSEVTDFPITNSLVFSESQVNQNTEYIVMMVKNLTHVYPNGENNPAGVSAANILWEWFIKYSLD